MNELSESLITTDSEHYQKVMPFVGRQEDAPARDHYKGIKTGYRINFGSY